MRTVGLEVKQKKPRGKEKPETKAPADKPKPEVAE